MIDPVILEDYERWLHAEAYKLQLPGRADHDDIVQEGRIAMWRALSSYDESLGSLPSWLTTAARTRMRDFAWGRGQATGHEAMRGRQELPVAASLDSMEEDEIDELMGSIEDEYHETGNLLRIIRERLTPKQQEYVFLRFWCGIDPMKVSINDLVDQFPTMRQRHVWQDARKRLQQALVA